MKKKKHEVVAFNRYMNNLNSELLIGLAN